MSPLYVLGMVNASTNNFKWTKLVNIFVSVNPSILGNIANGGTLKIKS